MIDTKYNVALANLQRYHFVKSPKSADCEEFNKKVAGDWFKASDVEALFRATEGQAQTSTAVGEYLTCCDHPACTKCAGRGGIYRVAQLAGSTAPGAPVDGINGPMTDAQKQEARHLYRNLYHLGPEATEDVVRYASVCGYVNGRKDFAEPADPTAQQSLTAGGAAFAELRAGLKKLNRTTDCEHLIHQLDALAAAPLPQVQSEALDANDICQLPPTDWYCTRKAGHAGPCAAHQHEPDRELDSDEHAAIAKGMARIRADQQPVTPSGALDQTEAARDVLAERLRQIELFGWDAEHDDAHPNGEIAAYAAFYAMPEAARDWPATETGYGDTFGEAIIPADWAIPKTGDRRRELVKAGALVLAEIERIDRAADQQTIPHSDGTPLHPDDISRLLVYLSGPSVQGETK